MEQTLQPKRIPGKRWGTKKGYQCQKALKTTFWTDCHSLKLLFDKKSDHLFRPKKVIGLNRYRGVPRYSPGFGSSVKSWNEPGFLGLDQARASSSG